MTALLLIIAPIFILLFFIARTIKERKKLLREFNSNIERINQLERSEIEIGSGHIYNKK
ncbi:hypothetical protein WJN01_08040 [Flavobacteriaceae bacterium SZ-1-7]|uniref:hypothetical protein n=1 Tax=Tamlana sedimenti TaxID=3134126 RepID=UPI003120759D